MFISLGPVFRCTQQTETFMCPRRIPLPPPRCSSTAGLGVKVDTYARLGSASAPCVLVHALTMPTSKCNRPNTIALLGLGNLLILAIYLACFHIAEA
jgi:hypothetical protein